MKLNRQIPGPTAPRATVQAPALFIAAQPEYAEHVNRPSGDPFYMVIPQVTAAREVSDEVTELRANGVIGYVMKPLREVLAAIADYYNGAQAQP